jgi:GNAT superfamily N-acetyltransferase
MEPWSLRRANESDAAALAACIDAAYAHYAARIADLPPVSADCAGEIAEHHVWVAEIRTALVGGLVMMAEAGFMRLANVAVHPGYKGLGLGLALIALAETESAAQGYHEMRLTTHVDMPENVRLYAHLGWQEDRRLGNKVSMKKRI